MPSSSDTSCDTAKQVVQGRGFMGFPDSMSKPNDIKIVSRKCVQAVVDTRRGCPHSIDGETLHPEALLDIPPIKAWGGMGSEACLPSKGRRSL